MAKSISTNFKFQGTLGTVTFVNSATYGHHTRDKRGTHTEIVITDSMQRAMDRMELCNQQAQPVYAALKEEYHDGMLWSRLLSQFQKASKEGVPFNVDRLLHLECNIKHKLEGIFPHQYKVSVRKDKKKMHVTVDLPKHPKASGKTPRQGYHLRVVVLYPDFANCSCRKEAAMTDLISYRSSVQPQELTVPMPSGKAPYMVLLSIYPIVYGKSLYIPSDAGMRVVKVG